MRKQTLLIALIVIAALNSSGQSQVSRLMRDTQYLINNTKDKHNIEKSVIDIISTSGINMNSLVEHSFITGRTYDIYGLSPTGVLTSTTVRIFKKNSAGKLEMVDSKITYNGAQNVIRFIPKVTGTFYVFVSGEQPTSDASYFSLLIARLR